jgi:hypothetical protein
MISVADRRQRVPSRDGDRNVCTSCIIQAGQNIARSCSPWKYALYGDMGVEQYARLSPYAHFGYADVHCRLCRRVQRNLNENI